MNAQTIIPLFFVGAGLLGAAFGSRSIIHAQKSAAWPHVPGRVTESTLDLRRRSVTPNIHYTYTVGGQTFTGRRITFGIANVYTRTGLAQAYLQRYPVGAPVTVYYDPTSPANCVLEPGITKRAFVPASFGLLFAMFGGWFAVLAWLLKP